MAVQCEVLGEMSGGSGFATSSFEIHNRNNLHMFSTGTARGVTPVALAINLKILSESLDRFDGIGASSCRADLRLRPFAFERQMAEITIIDSNELGCLRGRKRP